MPSLTSALCNTRKIDVDVINPPGPIRIGINLALSTAISIIGPPFAYFAISPIIYRALAPLAIRIDFLLLVLLAVMAISIITVWVRAGLRVAKVGLRLRSRLLVAGIGSLSFAAIGFAVWAWNYSIQTDFLFAPFLWAVLFVLMLGSNVCYVIGNRLAPK